MGHTLLSLQVCPSRSKVRTVAMGPGNQASAGTCREVLGVSRTTLLNHTQTNQIQNAVYQFPKQPSIRATVHKSLTFSLNTSR